MATPPPFDDQYTHLTDTGNGPTEQAEESILAALYGEPDAAGRYGAPEGAPDVA